MPWVKAWIHMRAPDFPSKDNTLPARWVLPCFKLRSPEVSDYVVTPAKNSIDKSNHLIEIDTPAVLVANLTNLVDDDFLIGVEFL